MIISLMLMLMIVMLRTVLILVTMMLIMVFVTNLSTITQNIVLLYLDRNDIFPALFRGLVEEFS